MITKIIEEAKKNGACKRINGVDTMSELVDLMFSPQGREYCENTKYLKAHRLLEIADEAEEHNVYIGKKNIISTAHNTAFIGSRGRVLCQGTDAIYNIIIADNAHAEIVATNFAVVMITNIGGTYTITKDKSVVIL